MNKEQKEDEFRIIYGVENNTFAVMVKIVTDEYEKIHKKWAEKMVLLLKKELK